MRHLKYVNMLQLLSARVFSQPVAEWTLNCWAAEFSVVVWMTDEGKVEVFVSEMVEVSARDLNVAWELVRGTLGNIRQRTKVCCQNRRDQRIINE